MLKLSDYCADVALLNMVHMYKRVLASDGMGDLVPQSEAEDRNHCACGGGERRAAGKEPMVVM